MRIKEMYKWQIKNLLPSYLVYTGILFLIYTIMIVMFGIFLPDAGNISMQSTLFFVFTIGIVGFYEDFKAALCNGISRKTAMVSSIFCYSTIVLMITTSEFIMEWIFRGISNLFGLENLRISTLSNTFYQGYAFGSEFQRILLMLLLNLCLSLAVIFAGHFMGTLNQRMSKPTKLIVYIGTPVLFVVIMPLLFQLLSPAIKDWSVEVFLNAISFVSKTPINASLISFAGAIVFCGLSYLCIRRAPMRTI